MQCTRNLRPSLSRPYSPLPATLNRSSCSFWRSVNSTSSNTPSLLCGAALGNGAVISAHDPAQQRTTGAPSTPLFEAVQQQQHLDFGSQAEQSTNCQAAPAAAKQGLVEQLKNGSSGNTTMSPNGDSQEGITGQPPVRKARRKRRQRKRVSAQDGQEQDGKELTSSVQAPQQQQGKQQQQENQSSTSNGCGPAAGAWSKSRQITPRAVDSTRWYSDTVQAADFEVRRIAGSAGGGVGGGTDTGRAETPLAGAVCEAMQSWLDKRLVDDMGFVTDQDFPRLEPLTVATVEAAEPLVATVEAVEATTVDEPGAAAVQGSAPPTGASPSTIATSTKATTSQYFARWAEDEGGELPVYASRWHGGAAQRWGKLDSTVPPPAPPADVPLLLHESHAAHEGRGDADEHARIMIGLYEKLAREVAALPVLSGRTSRRGTLPGAAATYTLQALVGSGAALQVACVHHLGDNYSRAQGAWVRYPPPPPLAAGINGSSPGSNVSGEGNVDVGGGIGGGGDGQWPFEMSTVLSAVVLQGLVAAHGDDAGMRLPPMLAPVQACIVPIRTSGCDRAALSAAAQRVADVLRRAGVRAEVDARRLLPGVRYGASERRGVPLRIEIHPRDVEGGTCTIAVREQYHQQSAAAPRGASRRVVGVSLEPEPLCRSVLELLQDVQADMRWRSAAALEAEVVDVSSYYELKDVIESGKCARGPWAGGSDDEAEIERETGARIVVIPDLQPISITSGYNTCLYSGYRASEVAIFARAL